MCEVRTAISLSRRQWLQAVGASAATGMAVALGPTASALARSDADDRSAGRARGDRRAHEFRTRVVLLGVAGGPSWYAGVNGVSSALVVDDSAYVVDCGEGAWQQYRNTFVPDPDAPVNDVMRSLRAVFLTHMHSDHTVDYNNLVLFGVPAGLARREEVVPVYGPGDRGSLPPLFGPPPEPPVVNPENPTPGTVDMTRLLNAAYAADHNDRIRDTRLPPVDSRVVAHDIPLPATVVANANTDVAPEMEPVEIYEDDKVRVTAILVRHTPTFPAFAFRFDTSDGSAVFSGDTAPDGTVATQAGVKTLVLNHLAPANNPRSRWLQAGRGFSGRLVVGEDGAQIGVGRRGRARGRPAC